ncbi:hypothetical protein MY5147_010019 [Beauveria neobassiana]|uniref:N-acetyltransferase domain-containing protein n=2 Tax=Beauveria bassiana TaxID=176275 RepID=A0A2S7Y249_BEABA|nr:putative N-acetyltransferase YhbS [Beauveria bassiana D1-5]PQK10237.1 hypothetical protein BB8028_0002g05610 [Beauveria bassiana]
MTVTIRPELFGDHAAIHALIVAAFPNSTANEPAIVDDLRSAGALTLSLVAVDSSDPADSIIGHVAFSPVTITPALETKTWLGLGPISVAPARQRQGIGSMLLQEGLRRLATSKNVQGCVLLGNPDLYTKFGFVAGSGLVLEGVPPQYFMSVVLDGGKCPRGVVKFHAAFDQSLVDGKAKSH